MTIRFEKKRDRGEDTECAKCAALVDMDGEYVHIRREHVDPSSRGNTTDYVLHLECADRLLAGVDPV